MRQMSAPLSSGCGGEWDVPWGSRALGEWGVGLQPAHLGSLCTCDMEGLESTWSPLRGEGHLLPSLF